MQSKKRANPSPRRHGWYIFPWPLNRGAVLNHCFMNVRDKISRGGGTQQVGWLFQHVPETGLLVAVHHAVWVSPAGELVEM